MAAGPSTIFTEMVSTTLRNSAKEVADNVSKHNALLNVLKKKKRIINLDGGNEIQIPLEYAENSTYQRYAGFDTLNINQSDIVTSAKYDWAQVSLHVVASGAEILKNSGRSQMINLVKTKKANALKTAANNFSVDAYSDGSLANQIGGLAQIIQTNGQGTVGGINSATWTFWQNKFLEIAGSNAYTKDTLKGEFNKLWLRLSRGADKPDLIVLSHDFYSVYESGEQQLQRYMDEDMANSGFANLKYKSAQVIFDDNTNFTTTAEKGYFLNTDYLYIAQHELAQWSQDDEKKPVNQHAVVIPYYWMGNMVCSNRSLQGVLLDAA
ncbi:phage major capsid protein [Agrobacterium tumefaciens]|uniref:phage major capsid protein n=1 Tax=Agrobacterium tumefaciens TaxID=358 RepID=UPI0021D21006|nr:phage major capsid protein [Agrobacterium tumefaciens]UXS69164.1 phage major capsid protein [Agrobacterium tumefaciens]UXS76827.1 phage major capsid protein [Agrobacterium tumefaciens]UXT11291.1 phage major capsid protein [Agrobacterium tumefaciens]UXT31991.1 phage major capsid protein [Agrobacterium tumefaciens]UXT72046.1 phage major capsid protein [Agrobacterium tumefaciens]